MPNRLDIHSILNAVKSALPESVQAHTIPLHEPRFCGSEWQYVKECIDTGWVSSVGAYVDRFEQQLAAYTGVKRAVACVNGTAALHMCLLLAGVKPGDEVLVPALTFVATANAVSYCGAVPHFIDSEPTTLGMDPSKLSAYLDETADIRNNVCVNKITSRPIRAIVPMHTFGHPADMDGLGAIARRFGITMIEDAAESLGSFYKGKHTGNYSFAAALSFNGNKVITTGGGGAVLTNDEELGKIAKHLTTTARISHPWEIAHDFIGYNYRMPNINAALGCAQLEQLPMFIEQKRRLAERYRIAFETVEGVSFFTEPHNTQSNYWLNTLLLDDEHKNQRDSLLEYLNKNGVHSRPAWTLMHRLPMYHNCPRMDMSVAENLAARIINIPSSVVLGAADA